MAAPVFVAAHVATDGEWPDELTATAPTGVVATDRVVVFVVHEGVRPSGTATFDFDGHTPFVTQSVSAVPPVGGRATGIRALAMRGSDLPITITPTLAESNTHVGSWRVITAAWRPSAAPTTTTTANASNTATTITPPTLTHAANACIVAAAYASFDDADLSVTNGFTERLNVPSAGGWYGGFSLTDKPGLVAGSTTGPTWELSGANAVAVAFSLDDPDPRRGRRSVGLMMR